MELQGRVALVTGAGVRLGRAIALALARQGADVAVHYNRSAQPAQEVAAEIQMLGRRAVAVGQDLAQTEALDGLLERCTAALGTVDVLVNSAAIFERGTALTETIANWDEHFAINLKAPFFLSQAFARRLPPDHRAHIVNIVDWRALRPGTQYTAYTLAKAGLVAMTKSLALGLAPQVQVNAIAPGAILPPPGDPGDYFARLPARIPLRHVGSPEDVVQAVLYLVQSDFVTGEVLHVTGGQQL